MRKKIKENLVSCINLTEEMNICFYQQNNDRGYQLLNAVLGSLMNVIEELTYLKNNGLISVDIDSFNKILESALQALENHDTVLFADIMQFEIIDLLKNIDKEL